ncbi:hypothetical protein PG997_011457 [Apiospora hydei]|uniref:Uncharacterized protein n=1 Tax=Apiospora hydei TaxID=1337664 RepID=A0ABR1VMW4_9PEZI
MQSAATDICKQALSGAGADTKTAASSSASASASAASSSAAAKSSSAASSTTAATSPSASASAAASPKDLAASSSPSRFRRRICLGFGLRFWLQPRQCLVYPQGGRRFPRRGWCRAGCCCCYGHGSVSKKKLVNH